MDELIDKQEPAPEEAALPAETADATAEKEAPEALALQTEGVRSEPDSRAEESAAVALDPPAADAVEPEVIHNESVEAEPDTPEAASDTVPAEGVELQAESNAPATEGEQPADDSSSNEAEDLVIEEFVGESDTAPAEDSSLHALIEAIIYVTEEPVAPQQIAVALGRPIEQVRTALDAISAEFEKPLHGMVVREIAGGYKMATKPEHHEAVRAFVKSLKPPLKLSLAALETLAVVAYKQPITAPEIMEIRGVQGAGVLKTLLDRKLIMAAGRKQVIGKPVLYKTTREFLVQFGLKDLAELPTLKDFEEIRRMSLPDMEPSQVAVSDPPQTSEQPEPTPPTESVEG